MKKKSGLTLSLLALSWAVGLAVAFAANPHADRVTKYEGPKTCMTCHPESAREVAVSLHYQHQAEPRFLKSWPKGQMAGMMVSY